MSSYQSRKDDAVRNKIIRLLCQDKGIRVIRHDGAVLVGTDPLDIYPEARSVRFGAADSTSYASIAKVEAI
jgi:hypothetical protein